MQKCVLFLFAVIMTYGITGCATHEHEVEVKKSEPVTHFDFQGEYKNWAHATSKIILDKTSPLYGFQQVFVNDIALDAYKKGKGYPDGSIIVIGFYEAIEEGSEIKQGNII